LNVTEREVDPSPAFAWQAKSTASSDSALSANSAYWNAASAISKRPVTAAVWLVLVVHNTPYFARKRPNGVFN
jgi:hypothetical protein